MAYLTEKDLDDTIAGLVTLRNTKPSTALSKAIEALKEYRDRRMHWKNLAQGVRVLNELQMQNIRETDKLRKVLIGR